MKDLIVACNSYAHDLISVYANEEDFEDKEQEFRDGILDIESFYKNNFAPFGKKFQGDAASLELHRVEVLLSTGGPAYRIVWEDGVAWMEYQDWGIPWTKVSCSEDFTSCVERLLCLDC